MNKKILAIDDEVDTLTFYSEVLEDYNFTTITAQNGVEGLKKAQEESPDLLVLDVMLPGLDGFEVCHRLRAESQTACLPILMLSAKAQEADKAMGSKVGADEYLTKPINPSELVMQVESLLARKSTTTTAKNTEAIAFHGI